GRQGRVEFRERSIGLVVDGVAEDLVVIRDGFPRTRGRRWGRSRLRVAVGALEECREPFFDGVDVGGGGSQGSVQLRTVFGDAGRAAPSRQSHALCPGRPAPVALLI